MRRTYRRRASTARSYTIAQLLLRQPKSLRRHPDYQNMMAHYKTSDRLRRLRISRRCYSLLHRATIEPRNLRQFYRTYRLPADPFFPLFFMIKRSYLRERMRAKEERHRYILAAMRSLPPTLLQNIKYLGYLERRYNAAGRSPLWQKELFPGTKKKANAYLRYGAAAWLALFRRHLALLGARYRALGGAVADRVLACLALELTPKVAPPPLLSAAVVKRSYRRLSMLHHPDRGGDPAVFIEIKWARDTLLRRPRSGNG